MSNKTNTYISVNTILSNVLPLVDDLRQEAAPRGFYISVIQKALEALALDSMFDERNESFDFPTEGLAIPMPVGAFNIKNIYLFSGTECNIGSAVKVYWKRNYYTKGSGYTANDRGYNGSDPFYNSHSLSRGEDKSLIRYDAQTSPNNLHYYNIQGGQIMFSASCASFQKVMVNFNGLGCDIGDVPAIPIIYRTAIEDYVAEFILRVRMAKDPQRWTSLWKVYELRLNKEYDGSWEKAVNNSRLLHSSQREELKEYLGRGQW